MTNQQGAPEALRPEMLDDLIETFASAGLGRHNLMRVELPRHQWAQLAVALSRLHAENERLAALVEAQQPAPSAAAAVGDEQKALKALHYYMTECSGHEPSISVFHRMVEEALAPQPSPTPQADSAPAAAPADTVVLEAALRAIHQAIKLIGEPDTERLRTVRRVLRGAVVVAEDSNAPQADSVTAPAGGTTAGWQYVPVRETPEMISAVYNTVRPGTWLEVAQTVWRTMLAAAPTPPAQAADSVREDAAFEAVRKKLCALPRYSFVLDDDGLIRRVQDRVGNWIEFDEAHALFDPVSVDAARKQGANHD